MTFLLRLVISASYTVGAMDEIKLALFQMSICPDKDDNLQKLKIGPLSFVA